MEDQSPQSSPSSSWHNTGQLHRATRGDRAKPNPWRSKSSAVLLISLGVHLLYLRQASAGSDELPGGTGKQSAGGDGGAETIGGTAGTTTVPTVPFCRAGADVGTIWLPVWDSDSQRMQNAKRIVVFGGKGLNYYRGGLSYLGDMWALHITNTGFKWEKVIPEGRAQPSPRWETGDSTAFDTSLVIYGGDDQNTNNVGALGDLWIYSPRSKISRTDPNHELEDDWKQLVRKGVQPGPRREPSLSILNSTLVLQGGKMVDGAMKQDCDSRLFLLDISDPKAIWREGLSLPGDCGVGQTMDTVIMPNAKGAKERVVVFGGCQWSTSGNYECSDDLFAYDIIEDAWEKIVPVSDQDADACKSVQAANAESGPASGSATLGQKGHSSSKKGSNLSKTAVCPGKTRPRPLGRQAHATAYVESKGESLHALFVFGGRENEDDLIPLGDLWMFDFDSMRWSEITPDASKVPPNRFSHSLSVWQGGAGDGVAGLVVFGGQSFTHTGEAVYMNDVWLYTPHTGTWREVSRTSCEEGASGIAKGGNWPALVALASLFVLVVVVQCVLHNICPQYEPPARWSRRRRRRRTEGSSDAATSGIARHNGHASTSALETGKTPLVSGTRDKKGAGSVPPLSGGNVGRGTARGDGGALLGGSTQPSYSALE